MANKIQLRRDTTANWNNVNPILADGEPGLDITTNQVKYGDGANAWVDLSYASGGGGLTDVDGVVTFPGDFLIGTLWPNDPMPGGDKESVVWAKDDTEYLGLWWGGDQTYPLSGYGPVAGIMIGAGDGSSTDDFSENASPVGTSVVVGVNDSTGYTNEWTFGRDGTFNTPGEVIISTDNGHGGSGYAGLLTLTNSGGGTNPNKYVRLDSIGTLEIVDSTYSNTILSINDSGNLTVKGEIHSNAGTGAVTLQASDGSNPRNFVFNTSGSLSLPHLATGGQGAGSFDANNNMLTLTSGDTVEFNTFSGMILVNCHNSGTVSLYLCGGGAGNAISIGDSKGSPTGTMNVNGGGGYTFTATETGNHVFCAIRTRTGA